ncbi:hypothetical protein RCF34_18785 [Pseudomonas sp. 102515]|uniref:hypothetical protein n=1 Tax=Pseudomonas sp. 102515 TaxID=3071568 RepID=UPI0028026325|nr:hypothetical protein [Pseudomonas sp. 102515]MDQ7915158.1 hypothetical protein [Pseudomonas sp. 102515]
MPPLIATFAELKDLWRVEVLDAPGKPLRLRRLFRRVAAERVRAFCSGIAWRNFSIAARAACSTIASWPSASIAG